MRVNDLTYGNPKNSLPPWVRSAAQARGYGDATEPLSLVINDDDIAEAFACAAQGDGSACVMAQAGRRLGAEHVYFYRGFAWVDFGTGPIARFKTSGQVYRNVIKPFDHGDRDNVTAGVYHLMPPKGAYTLSAGRAQSKKQKKEKGQSSNDGSRGEYKPVHTDRVVRGATASV